MKNIWVPISGQIAQQRKVETIANNIANANTQGFKKDQLVFKEHLTALDKGLDDIDLPRKEWGPDDFYRTQGAQNAHVKVDGSYTDMTQGVLSPTGNVFDLGIQGKGFYEVLTPNGIRYSRESSFTLNQNGELVTNKGFKLLSKLKAGEDKPLEQRIINLKDQPKISISKEGDIYSPSGVIGNISIVEFKDLYSLKKEGNALFINNDANNLEREKIKSTVNQGFVEGSNVNAIYEMSELIKAHRHFDNIQKAIKTYDSITGNAVNDIAKF